MQDMQKDQKGKQQPQSQPHQQPQQSNVNKWAGQGDSGQSRAGAIPQPQPESPSIQEPQDPKQPDRSQAVQGPTTHAPMGQMQQQSQQKVAKNALEDLSKSFGESQVGRESAQQTGDTGIIPKENSFPNYKDENKDEPQVKDETPEGYQH